jgi:dihydropteroate synthase
MIIMTFIFTAKNNQQRLMFTLNCNGRLLVVDKPLVMGIINITSDSFYPGSRFNNLDDILKQAEKMLNEKADIIDIGGQTTKPGSRPIAADEELKKIVPAVEAIQRNFPESFISIDTFYGIVAKEAVAAGACIINDVSAGKMDETMIETAGSLNIPYILMHMQGKPGDMQKNPVYENVTKEILDFFIHETDRCQKAGIKDVIIDPGFGFGKTIPQNFELLRNLSVFKMLDRPILAGLSRKSTISKTLGVSAEQALNGTTVLDTIALMNGANILRVHDVKEAKEAVELWCRVNER